ncbi:hypothetical protein LX16_2306 [Stackebrandtia albiflava]|uniref:YCII-related domain-containing protein n=1 Tax=Stackebrandtia albiflava TaxID=406432 RepID=A0A562V153_9ACTN|nr:YciI family protein [Stackebrandtia albiflava]TWJ11581.1 hypothetical protein LX16_2306 [Stackebrandtia albiflava]
MQYMMWTHPDAKSEAGTPPDPEHMAEMGRFIAEVAAAGVLVTTGGCAPSSQAVRIVSEGGRITTTDGPFTETKELIGGFAIIDVETKEEALEWSRRFWKVAGDGTGYVAAMFSGDPGDSPEN